MYGLRNDEIEKLKKIFTNFQEIKKIILFGSRSKGNFHDGSDIDLALIADNFSLKKLHDVELEIDELYMPYRVDLHDFSKIKNKDLKEHIDRVGVVFYTNNPMQKV